MPVKKSSPLPAIVPLFTKVAHQVRVVFNVPVKIIVPDCPGCKAGIVHVVCPAERIHGRISLMITPEIVAPQLFPYCKVYTTVSPTANPVNGAIVLVIYKSANGAMLVHVVNVLFVSGQFSKLPEIVAVIHIGVPGAYPLFI